MTEPGIFWSRSHCSAKGSTWSATNFLNSSCRARCSSANARGPGCSFWSSALRRGRPSGDAREPGPEFTNTLFTMSASGLFDDKSRRRVQRLEILDVQIVHSHFDAEGLFDVGHQLYGEQRIDDARFEQVVVIL